MPSTTEEGGEHFILKTKKVLSLEERRKLIEADLVGMDFDKTLIPAHLEQKMPDGSTFVETYMDDSALTSLSQALGVDKSVEIKLKDYFATHRVDITDEELERFKGFDLSKFKEFVNEKWSNEFVPDDDDDDDDEVGKLENFSISVGGEVVQVKESISVRIGSRDVEGYLDYEKLGEDTLQALQGELKSKIEGVNVKIKGVQDSAQRVALVSELKKIIGHKNELKALKTMSGGMFDFAQYKKLTESMQSSMERAKGICQTLAGAGHFSKLSDEDRISLEVCCGYVPEGVDSYIADEITKVLNGKSVRGFKQIKSPEKSSQTSQSGPKDTFYNEDICHALFERLDQDRPTAMLSHNGSPSAVFNLAKAALRIEFNRRKADSSTTVSSHDTFEGWFAEKKKNFICNASTVSGAGAETKNKTPQLESFLNSATLPLEENNRFVLFDDDPNNSFIPEDLARIGGGRLKIAEDLSPPRPSAAKPDGGQPPLPPKPVIQAEGGSKDVRSKLRQIQVECRLEVEGGPKSDVAVRDRPLNAKCQEEINSMAGDSKAGDSKNVIFLDVDLCLLSAHTDSALLLFNTDFQRTLRETFNDQSTNKTAGLTSAVTKMNDYFNYLRAEFNAEGEYEHFDLARYPSEQRKFQKAYSEFKEELGLGGMKEFHSKLANNLENKDSIILDPVTMVEGDPNTRKTYTALRKLGEIQAIFGKDLLDTADGDYPKVEKLINMMMGNTEAIDEFSVTEKLSFELLKNVSVENVDIVLCSSTKWAALPKSLGKWAKSAIDEDINELSDALVKNSGQPSKLALKTRHKEEHSFTEAEISEELRILKRLAANFKIERTIGTPWGSGYKLKGEITSSAVQYDGYTKEMLIDDSAQFSRIFGADGCPRRDSMGNYILKSISRPKGLKAVQQYYTEGGLAPSRLPPPVPAVGRDDGPPPRPPKGGAGAFGMERTAPLPPSAPGKAGGGDGDASPSHPEPIVIRQVRVPPRTFSTVDSHLDPKSLEGINSITGDLSVASDEEKKKIAIFLDVDQCWVGAHSDPAINYFNDTFKAVVNPFSTESSRLTGKYLKLKERYGVLKLKERYGVKGQGQEQWVMQNPQSLPLSLEESDELTAVRNALLTYNSQNQTQIGSEGLNNKGINEYFHYLHREFNGLGVEGEPGEPTDFDLDRYPKKQKKFQKAYAAFKKHLGSQEHQQFQKDLVRALYSKGTTNDIEEFTECFGEQKQINADGEQEQINADMLINMMMGNIDKIKPSDVDKLPITKKVSFQLLKEVSGPDVPIVICSSTKWAALPKSLGKWAIWAIKQDIKKLRATVRLAALGNDSDQILALKTRHGNEVTFNKHTVQAELVSLKGLLVKLNKNFKIKETIGTPWKSNTHDKGTVLAALMRRLGSKRSVIVDDSAQNTVSDPAQPQALDGSTKEGRYLKRSKAAGSKGFKDHFSTKFGELKSWRSQLSRFVSRTKIPTAMIEVFNKELDAVNKKGMSTEHVQEEAVNLCAGFLAASLNGEKKATMTPSQIFTFIDAFQEKVLPWMKNNGSGSENEETMTGNILEQAVCQEIKTVFQSVEGRDRRLESIESFQQLRGLFNEYNAPAPNISAEKWERTFSTGFNSAGKSGKSITSAQMLAVLKKSTKKVNDNNALSNDQITFRVPLDYKVKLCAGFLAASLNSEEKSTMTPSQISTFIDGFISAVDSFIQPAASLEGVKTQMLEAVKEVNPNFYLINDLTQEALCGLFNKYNAPPPKTSAKEWETTFSETFNNPNQPNQPMTAANMIQKFTAQVKHSNAGKRYIATLDSKANLCAGFLSASLMQGMEMSRENIKALKAQLKSLCKPYGDAVMVDALGKLQEMHKNEPADQAISQFARKRRLAKLFQDVNVLMNKPRVVQKMTDFTKEQEASINEKGAERVYQVPLEEEDSSSSVLVYKDPNKGRKNYNFQEDVTARIQASKQTHSQGRQLRSEGHRNTGSNQSSV